MSKKKNRLSNTVEPTTSEAAETSPAAAPLTSAAPTSAAPASFPLRDEITAFLAKREELAQKVADEIAATEKKLAELKQTAALLLAESKEPPVKDRKPKKLKVKSPSREEKPAGESPPAEAVA